MDAAIPGIPWREGQWRGRDCGSERECWEGGAVEREGSWREGVGGRDEGIEGGLQVGNGGGGGRVGYEQGRERGF